MPDQTSICQAIIFDTNAYRVFTFGLSLEEGRAKIARLRRLEQAAGILLLAHPVVAWELLTHLRDLSDLAYKTCLNSLTALGEHAAVRGASNGQVALMADPYSTVCRALFGHHPPDFEQGIERLGSLIIHIVTYAPNLSDATAQQNIVDLSQGMLHREQRWLKDMAAVLDLCSPGAARVTFGDMSDREVLRSVRAYLSSEAFFWLGRST
jgi:hypothetical protein